MISKNTELSATANERDPSTEMVLKLLVIVGWKLKIWKVIFL